MTDPVSGPLRSREMALESSWIDYNGHLNMAYYHVLFDRAGDELLAAVGLGPAYRADRAASCFVVEAHVRYLRELSPDDRVVVETRIVDSDARRMHLYQELRHAGEGWLSATSEQMHVHVDLTVRRAAPWPPDIAERIASLAAVHRGLGTPEGIGRRVGLRPAD